MTVLLFLSNPIVSVSSRQDARAVVCIFNEQNISFSVYIVQFMPLGASSRLLFIRHKVVVHEWRVSINYNQWSSIFHLGFTRGAFDGKKLSLKSEPTVIDVEL